MRDRAIEMRSKPWNIEQRNFQQLLMITFTIAVRAFAVSCLLDEAFRMDEKNWRLFMIFLKLNSLR